MMIKLGEDANGCADCFNSCLAAIIAVIAVMILLYICIATVVGQL